LSRTYATPLELELLPSSQQRKLLLFIYALAAISVLLLPWHFLLRLVFLISVLLLSYFLMYKTSACKRIVWQSGNHWLLTTDDVTSKAVLLPETLVSFWLVILLFRFEDGRRCSVLIWPDSVHADAFRRLRVRLKLDGEVLIDKPVGSKNI
jgi:hypothetical protein